MKVGIITGAFDLLHAGHMNFIYECQKRCDKLVIALHSNPNLQRENKNKPIETIVERQIKLISFGNVWTYDTEEDLFLLMQFIKPDVRFLGSDYKGEDNRISFKELVPIEYIASLNVHTSELRERIKES